MSIHNKQICFKKILSLTIIFVFTSLIISCSSASDHDYHPNEINLEPILRLDLVPLIEAKEDDVRNYIHLEKLEKLEQVSFWDSQPIRLHNRDFIYLVQDNPKDKISLSISMFDHGEESLALQAFQRYCQNSPNFPIDRLDKGKVSGVSYSYCVTPLTLQRSDTHSFSRPLGLYDSIIFIQKGCLTMRIWESTETLDRTLSNEAITHIATFFKETPAADE